MGNWLFASGGALIGLTLGYALAYFGRILNFFLLDALFIGVLGGAAMLLWGLFLQIRPGRNLVIACMMLACCAWFGQRGGDYRFALRAEIRNATSLLEEGRSAGLVDAEDLAQARREAKASFQARLNESVGEEGIWGYTDHQWNQGVLLLRFATWSHKIPLPREAVIIGQMIATLMAFLLAWIVVRRLQWLPVCSGCGRPLSPMENAPDNPQPLGDTALCATCSHSEKG